MMCLKKRLYRIPIFLQAVTCLSVAKNKKSGFSLIEMLMTIVVIAILIIPASVFIGQFTETTFNYLERSRALDLARYYTERSQARGLGDCVLFWGIDNEPSIVLDQALTVKISCGITTEYPVTTHGGQLVTAVYKVDVSKAGSSDVLVSLTSYVNGI